MLVDNQLTAYKTLASVSMLASVGVIISTLECLSLNQHYRDSGLFSWRVHRLRDPRLYKRGVLSILDNFFKFPNILGLFIVRGSTALLIFFLHDHRLVMIFLTGVLGLTSTTLAIRGPDGKNGADQMSKMIFLSLPLAFVSTDLLVWRSELFFLCGQLCLAYMTSGVIRIKERQWRDGSYLSLILRQRSYGNKWCWALGTRYPVTLRLTSLAILSFECLFPIALFLPREACWLFIGIGIIFHLSNAIVLGLNTFLWAYLALFPSFLFCNDLIQKFLMNLRQGIW
jgi:hypothetical protein